MTYQKRPKYQPVVWQKPVRVKLIGEFGKHYPEVAKMLIEYYTKRSVENNLSKLMFQIDGLSPSVNHMYDRVAYRKSEENGGGLGVATKRSAELDSFRLQVRQVLAFSRWDWKPTGPTVAILFFESPYWVTKERKVKAMDADNRVKPVFDAVEQATDTPDELYWQHHVFKVASKRSRTTVYLFDLGDVVEYYY